MSDDRIVAVALLTQTNLDMLRGSLHRVFKIDETSVFEDLLKALNEKDGPTSSAA